mmetsp:Transcript_16169/g.23719  ORF Transcript_16169/g.23719 Transcript_16169/m.23719 type:complete len:221 (+) Transcript_16169:65-727(+)
MLESLCKQVVDTGACETSPDVMDACEKYCIEWREQMQKENTSKIREPKTNTVNIKENESSIFDLTAKNSMGSTVDFSEFQGYVTVVAYVAKLCKKGEAEMGYQEYEKVKQIWPYSLEFLVFTFEHPKIDYDEDDEFCEHFDKAFKKKDRKIHVMEEVKIDGPNTHPVYAYFKEKFQIEEMDYGIATFFLITPDGDQIEMHQGASARHLKQYIDAHLHRDL